MCVSLTDTGARDRWLSAVGGLGVYCCRPSCLCTVGIGGEGSLWTLKHTAAHHSFIKWLKLCMKVILPVNSIMHHLCY